jgi:acetyl-CoA C-acetyltransferase
MMERAAIIGVGQTRYRRRHAELNTAELAREAALAALLDANLDMDAVGLVIGGVAPDALAGINHVDLSSITRPGIPYFRVNTGGATGSSAVLAALTWIRASRCKAVLVVAVERMGQATTAQKIFNSIFDPIYEKDICLSTVSMIALRATMLMQRYGFTAEHWAHLAARNLKNSLLNDTIENPKAYTADEILASPILSWPIHRYETCPITEGACAVVIAHESLVGDRKPAWIHGARGFSDTYAIGDRMWRPEGTLVNLLTLKKSAALAYQDAGITRPKEELDLVEIQAPFASSEAMAYPALGLCEAQEGPRFAESIVAGRAGIVINASGGPQAANPVSATALIRIAECAQQITGKAGRRQVDGIRRAVATGQGGATQFSTAVVLGAERL